MDKNIERLVNLVATDHVDVEEAVNQLCRPSSVPLTQSFKFNCKHPMVDHHRLFNTPVLMGVVYCSVAMEASLSFDAELQMLSIEKVQFNKAVDFSEQREVSLNITFNQLNGADGWMGFNISYLDPFQKSVLVCQGRTSKSTGLGSDETLNVSSLGQYEWIDGRTYYDHQKGYGQDMFSVESVCITKDESGRARGVIAKIKETEAIKSYPDKYFVHPIFFDGAYVASLFAAGLDRVQNDPWVPIFINKIDVFGAISDVAYCVVEPKSINDELIVTDCQLFSDQGVLVMKINGFNIKRVPSASALGIQSSEEVTANTDKNSIEHKEISVLNQTSNASVGLPGSSSSEFIQLVAAEAAALINEHTNIRIGVADYQRNFMELGLESKALIDVTPAFESKWGIELFPTIFFEHQSLMSLTEYLCLEFSETIKPLLSGFIDKEVHDNAYTPVESGTSTEFGSAVKGDPVCETPVGNNVNNGLFDFLNQLIKKEANLKHFDKQQQFMALGIDSGALLKLAPKIEEKLGIELYPTVFFEYDTLQKLADFLGQEYSADVDVVFPRTTVSNATPIEVAPLTTANSGNSTGDFPRVGNSSERQTVSMSGGNSIQQKVADLTQDIAVIGMAARLPDSENIKEFEQQILLSKDFIKEIPDARWDVDHWFSEQKDESNKSYSKWGSFVNDVDCFDEAFFGMSPREAKWTDPQLRLLLEVVQETIDYAGQDSLIRGSNTGVFVGSCFHEYWDEIVRRQIPLSDYQHVSSVMSSLSGRISYHFDLQGASIPLDNACASSLTAMHLACKALQRGELESAIVAGSNLLISPLHYVYFSRINALSPTGHCHSFDKDADGYVPGEGVAALMLKPLAQAEADGDPICAVIKGSAINHVGKASNPSSPRPESQVNLLCSAWDDAGVDPSTIGYIEAHGTGTKLGDPIEINALKKAFSRYTDREGFCTVGSTKAHIGHLEGAAGIVGVIKTILSMQNKTFPLMPTFKELNPYIKLKGSALRINRETEPWELNGSGEPRRAGVSSFGMTGNNAHVVIEEYRPKESANNPANTQRRLFALSARNAEEAATLAARYAEFIRGMTIELPEQQTVILADISYTLLVKRVPMDYRCAFSADSATELQECLDAVANGLDVNSLASAGITCSDSENNTTLSVILEGETGEQFVNSILRNQDLGKLAWLWCNKHPLDFSKLFEGSLVKTLPMPSYPFKKNRYWLPDFEEAGEHEVKEGHGTSSNRNKYKEGCYTQDWLVSSHQPGAIPSKQKGRWLVIGADQSHRSRFELIQSIIPGAEFCLDPLSLSYDKLKGLSGIIDLQTLAVNPHVGMFDARFVFIKRLLSQVSSRNLFWLNLTQSNIASTDYSNARDVVLYQGLVRALGYESGNIQSRNIYIADESSDTDLIGLLSLELLAAECYADIRYRNGVRYVPVIRSEETISNPILLGKEDVVLVTGASGGLAGVLIRELVNNKGVRKLVLMSQSRILSEEYSGLLTELAAKNVQIQRYSGRLHTAMEVRGFLEEARSAFGGITAVFHCAGKIDIDNTQLAHKDIDCINGVLEPKVDGLLTLMSLTEQDPLKLFLCYSSVASVFPKLSKGILDYSIANYFMDRMMISRGGIYKSLSWQSWKDVGIGEATNPLYLSTGFATLTNQQGVQLINRALKSSSSHIIPLLARAESDFTSLLYKRVRLIAGQNSSCVSPAIAAPAISMSALKADLVKMIADKTGGDSRDVNAQTRIIDMGLDSIVIADLIKELESKWAVKADAELFINALTVADIAAEIEPMVALTSESVERGQVSSDIERQVTAGLSETTKFLRGLLAEKLAIDISQVSIDGRFSDMGVDSIVVTELIKTLESVYDSTISPNVIIEEDSIGRLSQYFVENGFQLKVITESTVIEDIETSLDKTTPYSDLACQDAPAKDDKQSARPAVASRDKIAVVGIACKFPGAEDKVAFWKNLTDGVSSISEPPASRWDIDRFYSKEHSPGLTVSRWGGFVDGIEYFDPAYFGFSEDEAANVDPTIRLFLETAVGAFHDAGLSKKELDGTNVGVYVGARITNYGSRLRLPGKHSVLGLGQNFIAAHLAQMYNLTGPNMVIDTACSSSLVCMHQACQAIQLGEIGTALVGGVDVLVDEHNYLILSEGRALSLDGKCHTFDEKANGFVPGEGAGAVVLKNLDQALQDGDRIYGVIDGIAINNDGRTMGATTPNPEGQYKVIEAAYRNAEVAPSSVSYVEAHGTGTLIGDPIELKALNRLFSAEGDRDSNAAANKGERCAIGSVKTNIGHLLSAAGIASFIKTMLCIHNGRLVPTLNCDTPNPRFDFDHSPFYINDKSVPWDAPNNLRRAGISSFGFGGTNAHVLVSGLSDEYQYRYKPTKTPVEMPEFNKRYFWLDKVVNQAEAVKKSQIELMTQKPESSVSRCSGDGLDMRLLELEEVL